MNAPIFYFKTQMILTVNRSTTAAIEHILIATLVVCETELFPTNPVKMIAPNLVEVEQSGFSLAHAVLIGSLHNKPLTYITVGISICGIENFPLQLWQLLYASERKHESSAVVML